MDNVEYSLPYGWKKVGIKRKKNPKRRNQAHHWDFYVWSPCGKQFRSSRGIDDFLADNPKVKCDKEVTNNKRPEDFKTPTKGQLNPECIFEVIVSPKMPTNNLEDFCLGSLSEGRAEILQIFGWHFGINNDLINSF